MAELSETAKCSIYGLYCPVANAIRYIGKATDPEFRMRQHLSTSKRGGRTYKHHWISKILSDGFSPELVILAQVDEANWPEAEKFWIAKGMALGWPLTNICAGGNGASSLGDRATELKKAYLSKPETRKKMSESAKARWADPVGRELAVAAIRANSKVYSESAKRRATPEYRKMMSEKSKAAWADKEKRARIVGGITEETRKTVSESAKRMWRNASAAKAEKMRANLASQKENE